MTEQKKKEGGCFAVDLARARAQSRLVPSQALENLPVRLASFFATFSLCSRSVIQKAFQHGRIQVWNGETEAKEIPSGLGELVYPEDTVYLDGVAVERVRPPKCAFVFHKPAGVLTSVDDGYAGKATLKPFLAEFPEGTNPVGRLDKDTTGLLVLTNDGDLSFQMLEKGNSVTKEYYLLISDRVKILMEDSRVQQLLKGITLKDGPAKALSVRILNPLEASSFCKSCLDGITHEPKRNRKILQKFPDTNSWRDTLSLISLTISEGRNRIVRRMAAHVGLDLIHLHRARIANITLQLPEAHETGVTSHSDNARKIRKIEQTDVKSGSGKDTAAGSESDSNMCPTSQVADTDVHSKRVGSKSNSQSFSSVSVTVALDADSEGSLGPSFLSTGCHREMLPLEYESLWNHAGSLEIARRNSLAALLNLCWHLRNRKGNPNLRLEKSLRSLGISTSEPCESDL
mmetsp:Transcript_4111/g.7945  ORF Transcript_4111/g.7945 Transcript_4111/m.7945 type:complete len:458 (+) Transcript_4111:91-1464(+)